VSAGNWVGLVITLVIAALCGIGIWIAWRS
jgi:hypothetical protein